MDKIFGAELFEHVTRQILEWNYEPVTGISVFTKAERYAHIEINIDTTEHFTDEIIWIVGEQFIPAEYRQEINDVITFFANYLMALKGFRAKNLVFKVTDGSFNNDSGRHAFTYATVWALVNCFDKKIYEVSPNKIELVKKTKQRLLQHFRKPDA